MTDREWRFEGPYVSLANTAAARKGSIHDDEPARQLGFKGAFVPGTVVGACAMTAVLQRFGTDWLDGGWYDFNFVSPVYTQDRVRTTGTSGESVLDARVDTDDARLCCTVSAGLGYADPWDDGGGPEEVFPDARLGQTFETQEVTITRDAVKPMLAAASDDASRWEALVHPEHLMAAALRAVDWKLVPTVGVRAPGMWASHAIKMRRPMPYGIYRIDEELVEKGRSGRTLFVSFQFRVTDAAGQEVAVGRHKCKFIRQDAA